MNTPPFVRRLLLAAGLTLGVPATVALGGSAAGADAPAARNMPQSTWAR